MALKINKSVLSKISKSEPVDKKHTILVVDDEVYNLEGIISILGPSYHILQASDGLEALELVKNLGEGEEIHVIISDQRMPNLSGVDFLEKTIPLLPKAIRIILTGYSDNEVIIQSINRGKIYKFMNKPLDPEDLKVTINRALHAYELEQTNTVLVEDYKRLNATLEQKVKERTVELEDAYLTIKEQQDHILEELDAARETQKSMLPRKIPDIPHVTVAHKYMPVEKIGGDFYNIFELKDNHYGVMIADVTGHGPSAALISFMISGIFAEACRSGLSTSLALQLTNGMLEGKLQEGKFASIFYGIIDATEQTFTFTNGGHPYSVLIRSATQEVDRLNTRGGLVGIFPNSMTEYHEKQVNLIPGDKVLLFTDAIVEVEDSEGNLLGFPRFIKFLEKNIHRPIGELLELVYNLGLEVSGVPYDDDLTLVGFEVAGD